MAVASYIERQQRRIRRPIEPDEVPHLEQLAHELRSLRNASALSQPESTIRGLERFQKRLEGK